MIQFAKITIAAITLLTIFPIASSAFAYDLEKVELAGGLEETMGHLWALELNLNNGDHDLAMTHANHPVSELYAAMKPALAAADPAADAAIADALNNLADRTAQGVPLLQALSVVGEVRSVVDYARSAAIGDVSEEANFKLIQMKGLLETSIAEYGVAVSGGQIVEMAEFQDGLAFVIRAQQILSTIDLSDIGPGTTASINDALDAVQDAYDERADPAEVELLTNDVIDIIDIILATGYDPEKIDLAGGLEETMGHLWALALNLNNGDHDLAMTHANHPVSELYAAMKPALAAADPAADAAIADALNNLADRTAQDVQLSDALQAIQDVRQVVDYARDTAVGPASEETDFKLIQMNGLLETSIAEYGVAVSGGQIVEMAEFQDGLAFVIRAQQILSTIDSADIGQGTAMSLDTALDNVQAAYDEQADPAEVERVTNGVIGTIDDILALGYDPEKIDLAGGLEETMGHLWALELNLNNGDYDLVMTHANHPVSELYAAMKPALAAADIAADTAIDNALNSLADKTDRSVPLPDALAAVEEVRGVVDYARDSTVGAISTEANFKIIQMKGLLETSIAEYGVAVSGGQIVEMAEFQDGLAFVVRAEQILDSIDTADLGSDKVLTMYDALGEVQDAYDERADPSEVESLTNVVINTIDGILGIVSEDVTLGSYIDNIRALLADTRSEYAAGNIDLALSHAVKAYLNNFEFVESPLVNAGERDLMLATENMMRHDLPGLIRAGEPASVINAQIDDILEQLDTIADIIVDIDQ